MENSEPNKIVDAALELGKNQSWEAVSLHAVAEALLLSLVKKRFSFGGGNLTDTYNSLIN